MSFEVFRRLLLVLSIALATRSGLRGAAKTGEEKNDWPIIGIFAQPSYDDNALCGNSCQYIAASYVKYLEMAGARVVPIDFFSTPAQIDSLFDSLNGVLFPGGGSPFPETAQYVFDKVVAANDAGDYFPLWGTCMGFQWLLISAARDATILDPQDGSQMDSYNISMPLDFTDAALSSRLFEHASPSLMSIYAQENVTMNNHHYGIWTEHFQKDATLSSFYDALSTNKDGNGNSFISTIEAKNYPIYGSQWHPEKNVFEWGRSEDGTPMEAICHTEDGLRAATYPAEFFVDQARRSTHAFPSVDAESEALIYNYNPTYTGSPEGGSSFLQKYYFKFGSEAERAWKRPKWHDTWVRHEVPREDAKKFGRS